MTLQLLDQHRADLTGLRALAQRDLTALTRVIRGMNVAEAREVLKQAIPELMDPFLGAASESAAVVLEELYAASSVQARYVEQVVTELGESRVDALARWAVSPMTDETLGSTVLSRLEGATTRMIFNASRMQFVDGVASLPNGRHVSFQRFPRADCCAFCGMLASRPVWMAYRTEASGGKVVGRGSTRTGIDVSGKRISGGVGQGVKARGKREIDDGFHDDCRCVVGPILPDSPMIAAAASTRERFEAMYRESLADAQGNLHGDLKQILAQWRTTHGTH